MTRPVKHIKRIDTTRAAVVWGEKHTVVFVVSTNSAELTGELLRQPGTESETKETVVVEGSMQYMY